MNANDVVCRILDSIQTQLVKQIDDSIEFYNHEAVYTHMKPFEHKLWMDETPYKEMHFEYEWMKFTFLQLCNVVEMMFGQYEEERFSTELTNQVKETVIERLKRVTVPQVE